MFGKSSKGSTRPPETLVEGVASTFAVLAVGLFTLTFMFQNFVIPSSSMASTLLVGDHVMVSVRPWLLSRTIFLSCTTAKFVAVTLSSFTSQRKSPTETTYFLLSVSSQFPAIAFIFATVSFT